MISVAARIGLAAIALAAACSGAACGKKGSPLAPLVRIPAGVSTITASRLGREVYVTVTVPATNIDSSVPVDISRVDVYGYTGLVPPTPARWAELGTIVGSVPVTPPPQIGEGREGTEGTAPAASAPADPSAGALVGLPVTIVDVLTDDELVQGKVAVEPRVRELPPLPALAPASPQVLRRFYQAIPFSTRGRNGPPGAQAELPLTALPDPPAAVRVSYDASTLSLTWEPSGGLIGFLLDRALPPEPPPFDTLQPLPPGPQVVDAGVPPGPTTYNVYREVAPDPLLVPAASSIPPGAAPAPIALNPAPLTSTSVTDIVELGRIHCYSVRALRGTIASDASPRTCVLPSDVFPPAVPAGLTAVPSEGGISLIWEPGADLDLGGYLVLRREPGDATLRLLTATPIGEPRYRDTAVQPGARYIYSVVAVDTQLPLPNVSAESELVEEVAR